MSRRYYVEPPLGESEVALSGQEARHLTQVMRARPGEMVTLFDGSGDEFEARIVDARRGAVVLQIVSRITIDRELKRRLTVGAALPKGDRQRWMVEKLVELGAAALTPLQTRRGVAQPGESALTRLRRYVIEASKQCGRNRLMEIEAPRSADSFFRSAPPSADRWAAQPGGEPLAKAVRHSSGECYLAVGPEGGFDDAELSAAAEAGWTAVDLGPRILRVETAAAAVAAWLSLRE